ARSRHPAGCSAHPAPSPPGRLRRPKSLPAILSPRARPCDRIRAGGPGSGPGPLSCLLWCEDAKTRSYAQGVMNIGFLGLGNMGRAIAGRLLEAGHTLRVWNRSPEPARQLAQRGAQVATSAEEAFRGDVVFSMLSDDRVMRSVLIESGVLAR